jgi:threonine/homoserine/homoserine lactone efflux protein
MDYFLRSLLIGFAVAAIVGPIGVLCIQRTLERGFWYGLVTGLGAATADGLYGCVAGFGLTALSTFLINQQFWIRLLGGLFILYLGIRSFLSKPAQQAAPAKAHSFIGAYVSTFLLTLTNPMTILSFAGIFAGLGVGVRGGVLVALLVVIGTFIGSGLWWVLLAGGMNFLRSKITPVWYLWINRGAACIIIIFGVMALLGLRG